MTYYVIVIINVRRLSCFHSLISVTMVGKVVFSVLLVVLAVGLTSGSLIGGLRDTDKNNPGVKDALNFAVLHHNNISNDMYRSDVAEVVRVQCQVVAGIKYVITVKMARTVCRKDATTEQCAFHNDPEMAQTCVFSVWDKPWLNSLTFMKEECK